MEDDITFSDKDWKDVKNLQKDLFSRLGSLSPEEQDKLNQVNAYLSLRDFSTTKGGYNEGSEAFFSRIDEINSLIHESFDAGQPVCVPTDPHQPAIFIDHRFLKGSNPSK